MTWKRRVLRFVVIFAVVPYFALIAIVFAVQRWMIYQPTRTARLLGKDISGTVVPVDDLEIQTSDGVILHGWRFYAAPKSVAERKLLVLYFPGNAGCRSDRIADCRDFTEIGCDVVLFDYRGYADNTGSPSETKLAADATSIWKHVTSELHYSGSEIVIFGESMGGAMATRLAAEKSIDGDPPAALVLNSTFASLTETAAWHFPAFPVQFMLLDRYPSVRRIPLVTCPLLQFHGTADMIVPSQHGRRLFDAAPARSSTGIEKEFIEIPGGQHNFISVGHMQLALKRLFTDLR